MTSLHISSERSDAEDIVTALATELCDVNARNKLGRTALHLAAKLGNLQNLRVLLDAGCDRNIKDKLGFTAVGLAFKFNQKGSADILLRYKPRRDRSSSNESGLDENENVPVKRYDLEEKLHSHDGDCLPIKIGSKMQKNVRVTSLKATRGQKVFHRLCCETILRQMERKLKGKAFSRNIYHVLLFLLHQRRNELDGLATSRRTHYLETLFEKKMLTLSLDCTSLNQFSFSIHSSVSLDAKLKQLCLCRELKTCVAVDSRILASDVLKRLLRNLKDSLFCPTILSASVPAQLRCPSSSFKGSTLVRNDSEPAYGNLEVLMQLLRDVFSSKRDDSTLQRCTDIDAEESLWKIKSSEEKKTLYGDESNFIASRQTEDCLWYLEHVINRKSTSTSFVEELLEFFAQNSSIFMYCLECRETMFSSLLAKWLTKESPRMEDEIASLFLQVCVALSSDQRLLLRCAGAVMKQGLLQQHCNAVALATCMLVRMGLLKGEYDVCIVTDLKGPLLVLEHVLLEDYFPRNLAGIFASFLCKSSPRLFGLDKMRLRALASAVTKEILPTSSQEAERDTGKSFKRVCDIVAQEEDWEPLLKCVDAFFSHIIVKLNCRVLSTGESILIYLGLLKSEFSIEIVRNLKCALKVLRHMSKQSYFSPELKQVFLCFLEKPNPLLYSCSVEVDELLRTLLNDQADL